MMKRTQLFWGMLCLATLPWACDTLVDDALPQEAVTALPEQTRAAYLAVGEEEVTIDLLQGVTASEDLHIALETEPTRGDAELLESGTLRYRPYPSFTFGRDWLVVSLANSRSERRDTVEIVLDSLRDTTVVDSLDSCTIAINPDTITFSPDSLSTVASDTFRLDVLANDQLCSLSYQLTLPDREPNLSVRGRKILYDAPNRQDIRFRYQVCDSLSQCYEAYASVTFGECIPYLLPDSVSVRRSTMVSDTVNINVGWNDQVCSNDSVSIYRQPSTGEAWVENNRIIYRYPSTPDSFSTSLIYGYGAAPPTSGDTAGREAEVYISVTP